MARGRRQHRLTCGPEVSATERERGRRLRAAGPRGVLGRERRNRRWGSTGPHEWKERDGPRAREEKLGQTQERRSWADRARRRFSISILFSKPNSIMNQMQIQIEFQIYFISQIKMRNFGKFSKNKFYKFLKSFYFQIFFSFKTIFNFIFKSILNSFWILDSTTHCYKSNAPTCMHNHVATPYDEF